MRYAALLFLLAAPAALAQPGALDPTFDGDGRATTSFGSSSSNARAVTVHDDGRIVAAGYTYDGTAFGFALTRYHADGILDTSFGGDGTVTTSLSSGVDAAHAVVVQADGRIIVAGEANGTFALARYHADGGLDASFGDDGKVITAFGSGPGAARAVALQPDGRIVAAGYTWSGSRYLFALARYDADGGLDASFGDGGKVTTSFGTDDALAFALTVQDDGQIVLAGAAGQTALYYGFALARYDADGGLDSGFGLGGRVTTAFQTFAFGRAVALQGDGRIVVAGEADDGSGTGSDFALARYDTDGSLDPGFGSDGKVTTAFGSGNDVAFALAVQAGGRVVAVGSAVGTSSLDFALARYDADGGLDASFGDDGKVITAFGSGTDAALAVALQPDGRAVVAGYRQNGLTDDFALARYLADAPVAVSAVPEAPPVALPPDGGSFTFTLHLANATDEPQTVQVWSEADGPASRSPALGPRTVTLAPGAMLTRTVRQRVPAAAPAGDYVYTVHAGAVTSASFPLTKEAGALAARAGDDAWTAEGWDDGVAASASEVPAALALSVPSPHPFREGARIMLSVPTPQAVRVGLYDALGREVALLHDGALEAGAHALTLDGARLAAGVYVVRAEGAGGVAVRRVVRY